MDLYQSLVTVNPVTLIAQICNLFIQLLIVKIFFLDKIKAVLDKRRETADKQIADAEAAKSEAAAIKQTYEENMRQAKTKADDMILSAQKTAGVIRTMLGRRVPGHFDEEQYALCWIVDFPMYEIGDESGELEFCHNPFSMPSGGLDVLLKVCDALEYAHSRNVMHGDLKPANIMIGEYHETYIMDWGIARRIGENPEEAENPDGKRGICGTPHYLAPEMVVGEVCDQRADIFAMGVILFEAVTLKSAFTGSSVQELMENIRDGRMEPLEHRFHVRIDRDLKCGHRTHQCPESDGKGVKGAGEHLRHVKALHTVTSSGRRM